MSPGAWKLYLLFHGKLNDQLRGGYYQYLQGPVRNSETLAVTQFEATDARRAFPCWDEPDFKAVFATTLVVAPQLTAVSNTTVVSESMENNKRVVRFAESITMSTYLVAFIVGRLEATKLVYVGKTPLRLWTIPGKQSLTHSGKISR